MASKRTVNELLDQILGLPEPAQTEIVDALIDMRVQQLGVYRPDDHDRTALSCR